MLLFLLPSVWIVLGCLVRHVGEKTGARNVQADVGDNRRDDELARKLGRKPEIDARQDHGAHGSNQSADEHARQDDCCRRQLRAVRRNAGAFSPQRALRGELDSPRSAPTNK